MIQEIRIKNYLSFRDEVVLSFEATKDTTFEECQSSKRHPKSALIAFRPYLWSERQWKIKPVECNGFFTRLLVRQEVRY